MEQSPAYSEVLAHWQYTPEEWRAFVSYEAKQFEKGVRLMKKYLFITIAGTVLLALTLLLIPLLWLGTWRGEDVWGPVIGVICLGGFFLVIIGIVWLAQRVRLARLFSQMGDVYLVPRGIKLNGVWFSWGYEKSGWRLRHIERQTISVGPAQRMEVLEFKCVSYYASHKGGGLREIPKALRIPVPTGKETEADRIIERLLDAKNFLAQDARAPMSAAQYVSEHEMLGHDFVVGACRKCGSTAEEAMYLKLKCKG